MAKKKPSTVKVNDRLSKSDITGDIVEIRLCDITVDQAKYQARVRGLHEPTVGEYQAIYEESPDLMTPIVCVRINGILYLVSGFQRYEAARRAGRETIRARVIEEGNEKTAMREALGSNKHGLKLSDGDKKKAIRLAISTFSDLPNTEIARMIGCAESYVRKVKKEDALDHEDAQVRTSANPSEPTPDEEVEEEETSDDGEPCDDQDRAEALYCHIVETVQTFSADEKARFYDRMHDFLVEEGYLEGESDEPSDAESEEDDDATEEIEEDESDDKEDDDDFDDSDMLEDDEEDD